MPGDESSQRTPWAASGRIADALLLVLAESSETARRNRVLRALEAAPRQGAREPEWIEPARLEAALKAASVTPRLARRVGQALVRPEGIGMALRYSGLGTVEKAYRRIDTLLAREAPRARYRLCEAEAGRGVVEFYPENQAGPERVSDPAGAMLCGIRQGMLEGLPLLYGLLPAQVEETACAYRGEATCRFRVRWTAQPRSGFFGGAVAGLFLAGALGSGAWMLGAPVWALPVLTLVSVGLGAGAGRSIDLARQLEAVAGARRGHLSLLDQLDAELAERMDELARFGSGLSASPPSARQDEEPTGLIPVTRHGAPSEVRPEDAEARVRPGGQEAVDLGECIERLVGDVRPPGLGPVDFKLELESTARPVRGHPQQLELVIEQLLQNAASASQSALPEGGQGPVVRVSLRGTGEGIEVAIEDEGTGLDPEWIDEIFDPFEEAGQAGDEDRGADLAFCGRIVEGHGGEFRVQSAGPRGTRVTVILPRFELD